MSVKSIHTNILQCKVVIVVTAMTVGNKRSNMLDHLSQPETRCKQAHTAPMRCDRCLKWSCSKLLSVWLRTSITAFQKRFGVDSWMCYYCNTLELVEDNT